MTKRYKARRADINKQFKKKGYATTKISGARSSSPSMSKIAKSGRAKTLLDQERKALNMKPKKR